MAQRRMFSLKIIDTDLFLDMPITARLLYYDLSMRADDDGFVASPKKIQKMIGCSDDDLRILFAKQFVIPFESGVCVIKHWKIHNLIRSDRYIETEYKQEKSMLVEVDSKYEIVGASGTQNVIPNGNQMEPQVRLGQGSLGEDSIHSGASPQKHTFKPPTLEEVKAYCKERNKGVDAEKWHDFYTSKGWMVGKNKMKDWKAAVRTWEKSDSKPPQQKPKVTNFTERQYDGNALEKAWLYKSKGDLID
jgi:hypothetical protein